MEMGTHLGSARCLMQINQPCFGIWRASLSVRYRARLILVVQHGCRLAYMPETRFCVSLPIDAGTGSAGLR